MSIITACIDFAALINGDGKVWCILYCTQEGLVEKKIPVLKLRGIDWSYEASAKIPIQLSPVFLDCDKELPCLLCPHPNWNVCPENVHKQVQLSVLVLYLNYQ